MEISINLIDNLANLSKLNFLESEKIEVANNLQKITNFFDKINEIDTENIEPLLYLCEEVNVFRDDKVKILINKETALSNAPLANSNYFKVPKVIQK